MSVGDVAPGPDGRPRCGWALGAPDYLAYHDDEWGHPVRDDAGVFERLSLEAFQSGLSWLVVLRKRGWLREAFAGFDPGRVAGFGAGDVDRLLADPAGIRNRVKIEAVISNARVAVGLPGGVAGLVWEHGVSNQERQPPRTRADAPARSPASVALARELKRRGFRFVGPTTAYALMQAIGIVDDHLVGCWRRPDVLSAR
jgi:DNA-3-methyladenine glycosylase I